MKSLRHFIQPKGQGIMLSSGIAPDQGFSGSIRAILYQLFREELLARLNIPHRRYLLAVRDMFSYAHGRGQK